MPEAARAAVSCCLADFDTHGWQKTYTDTGVPFYVHHNRRRTSWHHPHFLALLSALDDFAFVTRTRHRMALKCRRLQHALDLHTTTLDQISRVLGSCTSTPSPSSSASCQEIDCGVLETIACQLATGWPAGLVDLALSVLDPNRHGRVPLTPLRVLLASLCSGEGPERLAYMWRAVCGDGADGGASLSGCSSVEQLLAVMARVAVVTGEAQRLGATRLDDLLSAFCHRAGCVAVDGCDCVWQWLNGSGQPPLLGWISTLHVVNVSRGVCHRVACSVCRTRPLHGLCYSCTHCWFYIVCEQCFLYGRSNKLHGCMAVGGRHRLRELHAPCNGVAKMRLAWSFLRSRLMCVTRRSHQALNSADFYPVVCELANSPVDKVALPADKADISGDQTQLECTPLGVDSGSSGNMNDITVTLPVSADWSAGPISRNAVLRKTWPRSELAPVGGCAAPTASSREGDVLTVLAQLESACRRLCITPRPSLQCHILLLIGQLRHMVTAHHLSASPLASSTPHHALSLSQRHNAPIVSPILSRSTDRLATTPDLLVSTAARGVCSPSSPLSHSLSDCSLSRLDRLGVPRPSGNTLGKDSAGATADSSVFAKRVHCLAEVVNRPVSQWCSAASLSADSRYYTPQCAVSSLSDSSIKSSSPVLATAPPLSHQPMDSNTMFSSSLHTVLVSLPSVPAVTQTAAVVSSSTPLSTIVSVPSPSPPQTPDRISSPSPQQTSANTTSPSPPLTSANVSFSSPPQTSANTSSSPSQKSTSVSHSSPSQTQIITPPSYSPQIPTSVSSFPPQIPVNISLSSPPYRPNNVSSSSPQQTPTSVTSSPPQLTPASVSPPFPPQAASIPSSCKEFVDNGGDVVARAQTASIANQLSELLVQLRGFCLENEVAGGGRAHDSGGCGGGGRFEFSPVSTLVLSPVDFTSGLS